MPSSANRFLLKIWAILSACTVLYWRIEAKSTIENWPDLLVIDLDDGYYHSVGGYPPENRNAYSYLLQKVIESKPQIVYLDMAFIRRSLAIEKPFEDKLSQIPNLVSLIMTTEDELFANYRETATSQGTIIRSYPAAENPFTYVKPARGIEIPEKKILNLHKALCVGVGMTSIDGGPMVNMPFYEYFDGRLYENAPLAIMNLKLAEKQIQIKLSPNKKSLNLIDVRSGGVRRTLASRADLAEHLTLSIKYSKIPIISAFKIQVNKMEIPKGKILLIGASTAGAGDKLPTPNGLMPGVQIIANEINTLWNMIKQDLQ